MKEEARDILRVVMYDAVVISSSSANHYAARFSLTALRNELQYPVTGGMTAPEMGGWFKVYSESLHDKLGAHCKDEIYSGGVPLFLKPFLSLTSDSALDKALLTPCFQMTNRELRAYLSRMLEEPNPAKLKNFLNTMESCILGQAVIVERAELIDPRYFYFPDGRGYCINGFMQMTVSRFLREVGACYRSMFLTPVWFEAMPAFAHNHSVLGFLVEEMVIEGIAEDGIYLTGGPIRVPRQPKVAKYFFDQGNLTTKAQETNALYVPKTFDFQHVDCVFIHLNPSSKNAVVMPIQITIAKRHKCSDTEFFAMAWAKWGTPRPTAGLRGPCSILVGHRGRS